MSILSGNSFPIKIKTSAEIPQIKKLPTAVVPEEPVQTWRQIAATIAVIAVPTLSAIVGMALAGNCFSNRYDIVNTCPAAPLMISNKPATQTFTHKYKSWVCPAMPLMIAAHSKISKPKVYPYFSPILQNTVWNVQTRLREIDMALHPSLKSSLGEIRTFVYSTLAGCCDFLDSVQSGEFSNEIESFAKDIVKPVVEECFSEIERHHFQLNNEVLKLNLIDLLKKIQQYPKQNEFKKDLNPELMSRLEKVLKNGVFSFYKLNKKDSKYYGGVLQIDKNVFQNITEIMKIAGYKEEGDIVGSSFDVDGHVTTIFSKELSENYEGIVKAHNEFVQSTKKASLKPICISYGFPQSGILSKAVVITVESPEMDAYRSACSLGKLFPPAHVSIFSKVVKPLNDLKNKNITFFQYIDKKTYYLSKLNAIFKSPGYTSL